MSKVLIPESVREAGSLFTSVLRVGLAGGEVVPATGLEDIEFTGSKLVLATFAEGVAAELTGALDEGVGAALGLEGPGDAGEGAVPAVAAAAAAKRLVQ